MKVSAFTFVKNAVKYAYPVVESINSILPLVDEFIVCLGDSEDTTNELIASINSDKIKVIHSVWDKNAGGGGRVLALETDKALAATSADADWLFYIQADEVVHEKYLPIIKAAMQKYKDDKRVEGLLFNYLHFYGSYKYLGDGRTWYSKEIRVIRNDKNIRSYRDAQGFRFADNRKLNVKHIDAYIYHYGWVKDPLTMNRKIANSGKFYNPNINNTTEVQQEFDYSRVDSVRLFEETHPAVMQHLVDRQAWQFEKDVQKKNFKSVKHKLLYFLWQKFGIRPFEYSNYKKI